MDLPTEAGSTTPRAARPAITDSRIQPVVSSIMPAARVIWPMSRRMRSISIRTFAMTGIAEMLMAVPTKSAKTPR